MKSSWTLLNLPAAKIQGENCVHSFIKYLYVDMFLTNLVDFCYLQGGLQASKHGIPGETSKNEVFN